MGTDSGQAFYFRGFLFDPRSGELSKDGIRVRLGKQSADILTMIILNAGSLVTRQTLRELLWPAGELVSHEKIINNAISRLRYIFRDDPLSPTFIERVPKRGYRWIMPVELVGYAPPSLRTMVNTTPPLTGIEDNAYGNADVYEPVPLMMAMDPQRASSWQTHLPSRRFRMIIGLVIFVAVAGSLLSWRVRQVSASKAPVGRETIALAIAPLDASGVGAADLAESFRLDLTDALAQLPHVQVRAAHSVTQLRLTGASYPSYSSKLALDVVVFGHFTMSGRNCQLQFEVVRGKDAAHLATLRYDGTVDQLSSIRDQIQQDVFTLLQIAGRNASHPHGSTSDPEAYEAYLQAKFHFSQQTRDSLAQSVKEYDLAIERDPQFAKAYIGLAQTQLIRVSDEYLTPQEGFAQASAAIATALRLDQSNAQVHSILGFIRFYRDWDFAGAIEEDRLAIRLDPHQAIYHQWLAVLLSDAGRYKEALSEVEAAQSDDPYSPSLYTTEAYVSLNARDYKRMLAAARKLKELLPESTMPYDVMANALWYSGRYEEGIAEWRRMAVLQGDESRKQMEEAGLKAFRTGGVRAYAKVRIKAVTQSNAPKRDPNDFDPFEWYMAAGDYKAALVTLRRKAANRDHVLVEALTGPFSDPIRKNPEYLALLKQTGLAAQLSARDH